jgi:hypothetical protein
MAGRRSNANGRRASGKSTWASGLLFDSGSPQKRDPRYGDDTKQYGQNNWNEMDLVEVTNFDNSADATSRQKPPSGRTPAGREPKPYNEMVPVLSDEDRQALRVWAKMLTSAK